VWPSRQGRLTFCRTPIRFNPAPPFSDASGRSEFRQAVTALAPQRGLVDGSFEAQQRHQLFRRGPARAIRPDGRCGGPVADQMYSGVPGDLSGQGPVITMPPPGSRNMSGAKWSSELRKPVHQRITSARSTVPSGHRTPSCVISRNIGRRSITPRARIASIAGVMGMPVTDTTEAGGSPRRTRSSTRATAARPASSSNGPSRNSGTRRVTQVVAVTREISSSNWIAEMPAPTMTTCSPANSSAVR
jgi:hypothetical protein